MTNTYYNLIAGEETASSSGETIEIRNPADTNDLLGMVQSSTVEDVHQAISVAADAFSSWAGLIPAERGRVLHKAANMMEQEADSWTEDLTREEAKPVWKPHARSRALLSCYATSRAMPGAWAAICCQQTHR